VPPLNPPIPQSRDERHVNRRDYVLPSYATGYSFWQFMRTHYEAHLVRRGSQEPEPRTRQERGPAGGQLPERPRHRAVRPDPRPHRPRPGRPVDLREQWVHYSKLIVGLSDEDVFQMVTIKTGGGDPAELVRQKIEDFRLGI
jgi:hypothetical protein